MEKFKIYLHGENNAELKSIEIDETTSIKEIIVIHKEIFKVDENISLDEYEIFLQDEDEPKHKEHHAGHEGIKKHSHVHCHRCKHINVIAEYNGRSEHIHLRPSTSGAKLLSIFGNKFNISPGDLADMCLKLNDGRLIEPDQHIGSFVSHKHCEITVLLIPKIIIKG